MWIHVERRFRHFSDDLSLTPDQRSDGYNKHVNVGRALERAYYGSNTGEFHPGMMVGSWGKQTQVRPPNDVDAFFFMPAADKSRFDARSGNRQSALLQEVKETLQKTFPQTDMRGDGQVVQVKFNTIMVEVVPVFQIVGGSFWMPDTNDGGRWKLAAPLAEIQQIDNADKLMNGNVRRLAKMIKHWKREKNVPLKSFIIDLILSEFLPARMNGMHNYLWYDFYVRDFFNYLVSKANTVFVAPGTFEIIQLGNDWLPRAQTAKDSALSACYWELHDYDELAGREWQKIFGSRCPMKVTA